MDDIGAEKKGESQEAELFRLINGRWNDGVVTMFTSNMPHGKLNMNSRTISRIDQASIILEMHPTIFYIRYRRETASSMSGSSTLRSTMDSSSDSSLITSEAVYL